VALHVNQIDEISMCYGAVVAFEKIVDQDLPIVCHVVSVAMRIDEVVDLGAVLANFGFEFPRLLFEGGCRRIEIDEDQPAELLAANVPQAEIVAIEISDSLRIASVAQRAFKIVHPRVIRAHDEIGLPAAGKQL
jgi:hypothetical protein